MSAIEAREDDATGRVALKTALDPPRTWFIFNATGGGHYAPGTRSPDKVEDWPPYTAPTVEEPDADG